MKQFAITRELASGVLAPSDIPNCILEDEDGVADPGMYYNQEFSIERVIKYLTADAFEIISQPQLKKSVGNPRIYILKRSTFKPWTPEEREWNVVQSEVNNIRSAVR